MHKSRGCIRKKVQILCRCVSVDSTGHVCRYQFERGCSIDDPECEACGYYNRMINMVSIVICECARFNIFWIEFKYKTKKK